MPISPPDIVLLLASHLRADFLGCYGAAGAWTPAVDRLTADGMRLDDCYATSPHAPLSRQSLLTGLHAVELPAADDKVGWRGELQAQGYDVVQGGIEEAVERLTAEGAAKPVCLVVDLGDPLADAMADGKLPVADIPLEEVPSPLIVPGAVPDRPDAIRRVHRQQHRHHEQEVSREGLLRLRRRYLAALRQLDGRVRTVLDTVNRMPDDQTPLLALTADSGAMLGDLHLLSDRGICYDALVRVPTILRHPRLVPRGQSSMRLVQTTDLGATFLDAAGVAAARRRQLLPDAVSLLPTMSGAGGAHPRTFVVCLDFPEAETGDDPDETPCVSMIREGTYKLIRYHRTAGREMPQGELIDVDHDWSELNDLWELAEYWNIRLALGERLLDWLVCRAPIPGHCPPCINRPDGEP